MLDEYRKEKKKIIGGALEGTVEKLGKIHGQYWDRRIDITKTVLTLTSAVLIGTITFSNFLINKGEAAYIEVILLKSSWVFFFESICCGIFSLWFLYELSSLSPSLINRQWQIDKIVDMQDSSQEITNIDTEVDNVIQRLVKASITPIVSADKRSHIALKAQLFMFGCGLLAFLGFGTFAIV